MQAAMRVPFAAAPTAVCPRTNHDVVVGPRREPLDAAERAPWSSEIFRVVVAAPLHHRRHALHVATDVACLPVVVVARVLHDDIPQRRRFTWQGLTRSG